MPAPLQWSEPMSKILVLGGTAWLSAEVARQAVAAGHAVTCLARGSAAFPSGVREIRADRTGADAFDAVADDRFDLIVDVARQPGQLKSALAALGDVGAQWVFVSTGSVYADGDELVGDESDPLLPPAAQDVVTDEQYGEGKVACENAFADAGVPVSILRAGLIGGPGDGSDRLGYWPAAFARAVRPDGPDLPVLVPDALEQAVQVVDVRDIATFALDVGLARRAGVFDVTGVPSTIGEIVELSRSTAGHRGAVQRVAADRLDEAGVRYWSGPDSLPLWLPQGHPLTTVRPAATAAAAGFTRRPLVDTIRDTLADEMGRGPNRDRRSGLSRVREEELLAASG
jgi:nucleoside-diphosphate-sugar epimerase